MKFIVEFTVPIYCSCVIESKSQEEAWNTISDYTFNQLKQLGYKPTVEDSNFENNDCDVINVKPFQENIKQ